MQKNTAYQKNVINKMLRKMEQLRVELDADQLVGDEQEFKKAYDDMINSTDDVETRTIMGMLFDELQVVRKRIKKKGTVRGWKWSPLMIQFCVYMRSRMNSCSYEFLRKVVNMPSNRTIMRYSNADTTSKDGIMFETIYQAAQGVKQWKDDNAENGIIDYCKLSLDSHVIKGKFGE